MAEEKQVSIIIPTFKRPDTLQRAINSVLKQTYKAIEIIVVDDNDPNTTDRIHTEKIMDGYKNFSNVIYVKHEKNKNGSAARNTGFRNSKGKYIMFLDDDDEFFPDKVAAQVNRLESLDESWGCCYTNYIRKKNGVTTVYGAENREGYLLKEELMRNLFIHAGSNLMIRRKVFVEMDGFDETFIRNQDIEFLCRILSKYRIAYVNTVGLIVHAHIKNANQYNLEEITTDYLKKFDKLIKEQPKEDYIKIKKMIKLQLFRYYLTSYGKRKKALMQLLKGELSLLLVIRYIIHLINRGLRKKAYGFDL
ncbi:glycosyltransferase family 2 protein [Halobacillus litoralis]|uniref:glycosyltransferase family 2 protein n=1 Tax=Halobacillus litoralis TaxID=45668 RepID=UPI001CD5AE99|nr:glycosyltransferase family 2 protein [Halobacillus litoralis]MCA1021061.1 glycosyltransferase [Halobacillus litoralis]